MELLLAILLGFGLGVFALSPFVPGLRPIVRAVVVGGMAAASTAAAAAAVMGEHWKELIVEARAVREAAADAEAAAAAAETITIPFPEEYRARGEPLDERVAS
jgi:hypothetical protein